MTETARYKKKNVTKAERGGLFATSEAKTEYTFYLRFDFLSL